MKRLWLTIVALVLAAQTATAQTSHIGYIYPAGGKIGTTFEIAVGGQRLIGADGIRVSGEGIEAKVIEHLAPLQGAKLLTMRDELAALLDHKRTAATRPAATRPWTDTQEQRVTEIRRMLALLSPRPASPAIAEVVRLEVKISPNAEPGWRELRLVTATGLTNPMLFEIGRLEEFTRERATPLVKSEEDMSVKLPAVLNGQITPGQIDRYRFAARKGDHLVAIASARKLVPYLADAVPGWFQATLSLTSAAGKEIAFVDDFRFQVDPIVHCIIPADGEYVLSIKDSIYRGREDFVYRIALGELPVVTSIFPLGGMAGERTPVELKGWNLASHNIVMDATALESGVHPLSVTKRSGMCNSPPFAVDTLPQALERETNNTAASAQQVSLPIIINGRIDRAGDCDVFAFEGGAGQKIVAEVLARRLDSPVDSTLKLTDAAGTQIAINDDHEDKSDGLNTHHADSYLTTTLPAAGKYFLHIADVQHAGGVEYAYRLRISDPRPDFELRVVPSSINLRPGGTAQVTVFALRKDGFTGEINIALKDAPASLKLSAGKVPANQDQLKMTLSVTRRLDEQIPLDVQGTARIDGETIVRRAVPAEDMMQAFIYKHLVCAQELMVAVPQRRFPAGNRGK